MVYGLIIHNFTGTVFHYQFYTPEGNDEHRKARIYEIVSVVCSEHRFRVECTLPHNERRQHSAATTMSGGPMRTHRSELVTTATPAEVLQTAESVADNNPRIREAAAKRPTGGDGRVGDEGGGSSGGAGGGGGRRAGGSGGGRSRSRSGSSNGGGNSSRRGSSSTRSSTFACEPPERGLVGGFLSSLREAWVPSPSATSVSPPPLASSLMQQASDDGAVQSGGELAASEGIIRIPRNELLAFPKLVVWRQVLSTAFVLVCDPDDNLALASNFLSMFVSLLCETFNNPLVTATPEFFLAKPEVVMELTSKLLPCGQLLFMSPSMAQYVSSNAFQANSYDMAESSDFVSEEGGSGGGGGGGGGGDKSASS